MNKADEALADVRRWLCDNLSDGDAGKVCGMLSVVSRRIAEIEEENAKLRESRAEMYQRAKAYSFENAKLRELCSALYEFAYDEYPDSAELNFADRMRELGVESDR